MPIDPTIALGGKPVQIANPLDQITAIAQLQDVRAQAEARRVAADTARQKALDDAQVRSVMSAAPDVDTGITQLYAVNPRAAASLADQVGKARKEQLDAAGKGIENQKNLLAHYQTIYGMVNDEASNQAIRPLFVKAFPALDAVLPTEYGDGSGVQRVKDAVLSQKDKLDAKQKTLDLFANGKFHQALGNVLAQPDITPEKWDQAITGAIHLGMPKEVGDEFGGVGGFSPANVQNAARLAISPEKRAELAGQEATRAQTAAHQTVEEQQGAARLAQGSARLALERDAQQAGLGALTPEGLALTAHQYAMTGQLPPMGMGKQGAAIRTAIINKAAETYKNLDLPTQIAAYKANQASLTKLQGTADKVQAFENTAGKNLDQFLALAAKIPDTGIPWLNQPVRAVNVALVGSQNQAAFNAARDVALREIARVTNDPNLSGALTDSARREVSALSPETATFAQIRAVAKVLKQDMANVRAGLGTQITDIRQRIAMPPGGPPAAAPAAPPPLPAGGTGLTYQDYLTSKGQR